MAEEGFKRKLAGILSADVEGYSRLMDDDEEATVRTLTSYRNAITDLVQQFRGRVVDAPGDNLLAEFTSVVDAVNCAVEIQRDLAERNTELAYNRQMQFRIGVNLGDVIEEDGRIYGDGVNIAARVESLAEAGGICISGRAHDQVENKLGLEYEDLGKHEVKNISRPIQVYRVLSYPGAAAHRVVQAKVSLVRKWRKIAVSAAVALLIIGGLVYWQFYMRRPAVEPASVAKMAYPLPDKPSIAVLAFENMSGDPKQDYFSDGLTDQIISTLSKIPNLFVVARNSTFTYKGKPLKIKKVAEDLGVKYVLEGSVQRTTDRVRITAQLIDATTGYHVWSERYDREQEDIFEIQDDITMEITKAIGIELIEGEQARIWQKTQTSNLNAYEKVLQGRHYMSKQNKKDSARARSYYEKAMALDPNYARPYLGLGWIHWQAARYGWVESPKESIKMAYEFAQKAINLDDNLEDAHALLASIYVVQRQHDKAIELIERAVANSPNSAHYNAFLGGWLGLAGRWQEGIRYAEWSIRLSPYPPSFYYWILGRAYYMTGQYEKAIETFKKAVSINPDFLIAHAFLAACHSSLGRQAEAAAQADEVLRINPQFTLEAYAKTLPYKNKADIDRYIAALRKAGLPYTPPLPLPDKPSIAVLAFDNLSGDPEQEYFSDGLSEEIINALSKTDQLFVIARNSSFTYKGKPVDVKQISRELGVRYVLEGSVRKSENRVRITAQLIDATKGHHLWSERYDRDLKDIFAVQDEITMKIITALQVKLTEGEQMRMWAKRYKTLDVQLKAMELLSLWRKGTVESHMRHGEIAQELINKEPELAVGYRSLGWHHWFLAIIGKSPRENLKKAFVLAQKAISLDESDGFSYGLLSGVYSKMRQHEKAITAGERAIELDPNVAVVHLLLGQALTYAGMPDQAIEYFNKAIRLNPFPNYMYPNSLGLAYLQKGQYDKALTEFKKALQLAPKSPPIHFNTAIAYILLDREEEAHTSKAKCLELAPFVSVEFAKKTSRWKNQADLERIVEAMRKAGFPEGA
jgi:adenylate cyclase